MSRNVTLNGLEVISNLHDPVILPICLDTDLILFWTDWLCTKVLDFLKCWQTNQTQVWFKKLQQVEKNPCSLCQPRAFPIPAPLPREVLVPHTGNGSGSPRNFHIHVKSTVGHMENSSSSTATKEHPGKNMGTRLVWICGVGGKL